jgi:prophage regulatory protein
MDDVKKGARRMLTMEQVLELVPVGRSTLKRMVKNEEFPNAHYISPRKMVWYEDEIELWQGSLPAESRRKRAERKKAAQSG